MLSRRRYRTRDEALSRFEARVLVKLPWECLDVKGEKKWDEEVGAEDVEGLGERQGRRGSRAPIEDDPNAKL